MVTRKVFGLIAGMSLWLLLSAASHVGAAEKPEEKPVTSAIQLSHQKIHHPCARKSAHELNKKASPFLKYIQAASKRFSVDADLVKSVITIESCYRQKALSPKSAQGLMQLIPATADRFGISNVYDPEQNVRGGTQYLGWLSKRFNGDLQKVLAGYNAGEGKVDRYNGIPPYRETRNYVHDVLVVYKKLKSHNKQLVQIATNKHQAKLAAEYRKKQLVRQRAARLAEQRKLAALTPSQRKRLARQAELAKQVRQRQAPARQKQLAEQMRQRKLAERQRQLVKQVRDQKKRRTILTGDQVRNATPAHEMITGQMSQPIKVQHPPVLRKVSKKIIRNAATPAAKSSVDTRVKRTYTSPVKPGRGGWEANKRRAPQLYKQ